ncbi:hypothetical protein GIB67_007349 [Kingdonia uniflora]|uniref:Pentatricopeptide repeat-containing protein n=1 Tax=Kingdonia uniflora TaxID=39325 RepID=A0A7J7NY34_9MAGN|nr:hypothetical protein GIB67_007349 [Kingdonia uniflora]
MEINGIKADVATYNALIGVFCKTNKFKNVFQVLNDMNRKGVLPNSRTCNIIMNSLISRGVCDPDADTYTMIIKMFCENDKLKMAMKVWKYMQLKQFVPSMHTFYVLINGLCEKGEVINDYIFLEEMIEKGIRPSGLIFGKLRKLLIKEKREDVLEFLVEKMKILVNDPL